ncbi:MAG: methylmalonyl-CoA carboxyltransferase, partial [Clostridia bacterium]|nr:methylmalonyl-CoA carboxyltransferase [Clostridia bacterium]
MWETKSLQTLKDKRTAHANGGGQARIDKQHSLGKMTAMERLEYLFDRGTFVEVNSLVESRILDFGMDKKKVLGDGVITGYGRIGGKLVFASSQDFTVGGGSLGEAQAQKICRVMDMAYDMRAPFLSINDSGGARIEEGIDSLSGYGGIFYRHSRMSGVVPQIAAIMGPCAGGACYAPALCDFIFMTEETSQMYITGPQVIKAVTGENVTTAEL